MAGPSLSHILDPMGPGSDPRPLPAPGSVLPPPLPLVQPHSSDATATSSAGSAPSNPTAQRQITMQAVPSSAVPGPPSASPPGATTAPGTGTTSGAGITAGAGAGAGATSNAGYTAATTISPAAVAGAAPGVSPEPPASASASASHQNSNPYACRDCGRSYSRPEHLVRHVQTHTLGRRFACEICKKSFARKDLLRRHVTNHENDSPKKRQRMVSSPNSSRVSQACRPCALARVKCDEAKPCRRCVSRNLSCSSYEPASGTSLHLVHLPASGQDAAQTHPTGNPAVGSTDASSTTQKNASMNFIRDTVTSKSSPLSQSASSSRQEDSQLTTPDTGVEQGESFVVGIFLEM